MAKQKQESDGAQALMPRETAVGRITEGASPAAIQAAARVEAEIRAQFTKAMMSPRDMDEARVRVLATCRRPRFADNKSTVYQRPVGKTKEGKEVLAIGPGIRLAEELARQMRNLRCQVDLVEENAEQATYSVGVLDLEANTSYSQIVRVAKKVERKYAPKGRVVVGQRETSTGGKVFILEATDDEMLSRTNSAISKSLRNSIIRLMPSDVVDEAIDLILATRTKETAADPDKAIKDIYDGFMRIGVSPGEVGSFVQQKWGTTLVRLTPEQLGDLRLVWSSIHDGEATWENFTSDIETGEEAETQQTAAKPSGVDRAKEQLRKTQEAQKRAQEASRENPPPTEAAPEPEPVATPVEKVEDENLRFETESGSVIEGDKPGQDVGRGAGRERVMVADLQPEEKPAAEPAEEPAPAPAPTQPPQRSDPQLIILRRDLRGRGLKGNETRVVLDLFRNGTVMAQPSVEAACEFLAHTWAEDVLDLPFWGNQVYEAVIEKLAVIVVAEPPTRVPVTAPVTDDEIPLESEPEPEPEPMPVIDETPPVPEPEPESRLDDIGYSIIDDPPADGSGKFCLRVTREEPHGVLVQVWQHQAKADMLSCTCADGDGDDDCEHRAWTRKHVDL